MDSPRRYAGCGYQRRAIGINTLILLLLVIITACDQTTPPNDGGLQAVTAVPTLNLTNPTALCASVDALWGRDWMTVLDALNALETQGVNECDSGFRISDRLYSANIAYGTLLEQRGLREAAISAYETALIYNFNDAVANERLRGLQVATPTPPPGCDSTTVQNALNGLPQYQPTAGQFISVENGQLWAARNTPYPIYGINYYPRDYPNERFLSETDVESILFELDLIQSSGINTLRIPLRHEQLFICPGNGAIPSIAPFTRLDAFIAAAAERDFRVILVLNVDADLTAFPLYSSPIHTNEQMAFIARRYNAEPAVMAYDLRDGGDLDYTIFERERVLLWLAEAATIIRQNAPDQLVTAGWHDNAEDTAPLVDFVSFRHFGDIELLRQEIAVLNAATLRPIVLAAVGYNTFDLNELGQRQAYQRTFEAIEQNNLAGWVVSTAFDYPLSALCPDDITCEIAQGASNRFGLWNTSYFPKRAVDVVELATGFITADDLVGEN